MRSPRRSRMEPESIKGAPLWMVSFSDIMTLLVTFFVMLMTFKSLEGDSLKEVMRGLGLFGKPDPRTGQSLLGQGDGSGDDFTCLKNALAREEDLPALQKLVRNERNGEAIGIVRTLQGTRIRMRADFLFHPRSTTLSEEGRRFVEKLGRLLQRYGNRVVVEGHAEPWEEETGGGKGQFDLDRALSAAAALRDAAPDRIRMGVAAYGSERPADPGKGFLARSRNRRVEVLVLPFGR